MSVMNQISNSNQWDPPNDSPTRNQKDKTEANIDTNLVSAYNEDDYFDSGYLQLLDQLEKGINTESHSIDTAWIAILISKGPDAAAGDISTVVTTMSIVTTTARESDKFRLLLASQRLPSTVVVTFALGYELMGVAICLACKVQYDTTTAIVGFVYFLVISGLIPMIYFYFFSIKIGHPIRYWKNKDPEDYKRKLNLRLSQLRADFIKNKKFD
eukprot:403357479